MDISDGELFKLVIEADNEGLAAGEDPKKRSVSTLLRVLRKLKIETLLWGLNQHENPIVKRIRSMLGVLYRPEDIAVGGVHMGVFMFRDIFAKVDIPMIFGEVGIDPLRLLDLNEDQKIWLQNTEKERLAYNDQFCDLFDFGFGSIELGHSRKVPDKCISLMGLAKFHFQAAAAVVTVAYDYRGAVQSALLGTELVLKGALVACDFSEEELKGIGHDLVKLAHRLGTKENDFDQERVLSVLNTFPEYVPNRYSNIQPERIETGHIIMGAQYIAGEVMRQFTDRNLRTKANITMPRSYPRLK